MPRDEITPYPADVAQHRADMTTILRASLYASLFIEELALVSPADALEPREVIEQALDNARARVRERADEDYCLHDVTVTPLPPIDMVELARRVLRVRP